MQHVENISIGEATLGQIAAQDLRKAEVFKKYGLDFCCGGKKTVKQACAEKGLDISSIEYELQHADEKLNTRPLPFDEWDPGFLADYIVNVHHSYVKRTLPEIRKYAAKVAVVHGKVHPELKDIHLLVETVNNELMSHMEKEEQVLFPFIKTMISAARTGQPVALPDFGAMHDPIAVMEADHELVGTSLQKIRSLSNNYTPPADACATYGLLYKMLDEFENDLHIHVHLENNILFPRVLSL